MKTLDRTVTNNIKNKDHHNDAIEYEPKFDSQFILSKGTKDPLLVVTVSLRGGKKQRENIIYGLTCLWGTRGTGSMIKIQYTKPYECKIRS